MKKIYIVLTLLFFANISRSQSLYFPPITGNNWDTIAPTSLNWDVSKIPALYDYLDKENSKAFIVLKDGKIVLEKYFGTFTKDSVWYWASAGKSMTSFLIGKAQEDKILNINDATSKYLGNSWTKCTKTQEDKITILNQITMTTGLDDGVPDNHCTIDSCLIYKADAGKRWAYHNAPYTLLEKVIENASNTNINTYTQQKLKSKTGITGLWYTSDNDNVFYSKARSFARYGLFYQNNCIWDKDTLLKDTNYINKSINSSQSLNNSYGYLWWLNGKSSYMLPTLQTVFKGSFAPNAPSDMFAGMGKNGQQVCISKSNGLVVVRMGEQPSSYGEISFQLCDQMWKMLNEVMKVKNDVEDLDNNNNVIYPNPSMNNFTIKNYTGIVSINDVLGNEVWNGQIEANQQIDISKLEKGFYFIKLLQQNSSKLIKLIKIE